MISCNEFSLGLEKGYDTINWHGMWQMLRVYGVGIKLLKAVQSFYVDSRMCLQIIIARSPEQLLKDLVS